MRCVMNNINGYSRAIQILLWQHINKVIKSNLYRFIKCTPLNQICEQVNLDNGSLVLGKLVAGNFQRWHLAILRLWLVLRYLQRHATF